jgi:hypothetical protein
VGVVKLVQLWRTDADGGIVAGMMEMSEALGGVEDRVQRVRGKVVRLGK